MTVELTEQELDFLKKICDHSRLNLFAGRKYVTYKLDFDSEKLDALADKLWGSTRRCSHSGGQ